MTAAVQSNQLPDLPYPGIEPFNYARRKVFFAREKEARTLMQLIAMYRGVLLYSDSGIGKSSLVNAGLIPLAVDRAFQPERIRIQPKRGEEIIIKRLSERADDKRPFLPSIFAPDERHERVVISVEEFEKTLRQPGLAARTLLVFDQFEEWITLFEEDTRGQTADETKIARESIRKVIVSLINDRKLKVKVLIVLREDYLAKLDPLFEQCPSLPDHYLRLTALGGDQVYRIIRGPFEAHPGRYQAEVSPTLAKKIQEQFEERSEGTVVHLTEVQIVCRSLFEAGRRGKKIDKYFTGKGDVQGILERYLELALKSLNIEQQEPAIALLTRMLTSAGTRNVISEDDLINRVENEEGTPRELLGKTLQSLEQRAKLVLRERRREVYYYEIASEFLVEWIQMQAQERQRLVELRELEKATRTDEQRRVIEAEHERADAAQRRAQGQTWIARCSLCLTAVPAVVAVVAILTVFGAYRQVKIAEEAQTEAEKQLRAAQAALAESEKQRWATQAALAEAEEQRLAAQAALAEKEEEQQIALGRKFLVVTNSIGMKLVYIPAGSFAMGSSNSSYQRDRRFSNEYPQHQVHISKGFWMGQTEVTQGQYEFVMKAQPWSGEKSVQEDANNPAVYVSWNDAVEFCRKLSQQEGRTYRLPTEAEWEYACRAGTTTRFSFGDSYSSLGDYAWYRSNTYSVGQAYAHPVRQKKPNPWGLYDMHGNVSEWCSDHYGEEYYSNSPSVDPNGPRSGTRRSLRGGYWGETWLYLRSSDRRWSVPERRWRSYGFRVVLP